ncbi:MAG: hypothetical protein IPP90_06105 [Gemmatimonadaceae bacterium]|nr:hypothetical protein [Gemmatimonadaceae bacterium]
MTWILSLVVAALSAATGLVLAGFIASLATSWYRISSFEGGAGYFVIVIAIGGALVGGVVGLVVARAVAAGTNPGFLKAMGLALGAVTLIAVTIGGVARMRADVAPEADGDGLLMAVEFRWPAADTVSPASYAGAGWTRLGTSEGRVTRKSEDGPLFVDLARYEDGHWVVPGAARLFTTRGDRVLDVGIGEKRFGGFLLSSKGNSNAPDTAWSAWFPHAKPGAPPLPDQFSYRFRVMRATEPVRTDAVGPFTIETLAGSFSHSGVDEPVSAHSTFRLAYRGQPMPSYQAVGAVAVVGGARTALLVQSTNDAGDAHCVMLTEDGSTVRSQPIGTCYGDITGEPLTADATVYHAARTRHSVSGWVDRATLATPGLYLVNNTVLDTRTLSFQELVDDPDARRMGSIPPVSLAPDERSFVWFSMDGSDHPPMVGVTEWKTGASYTFPIDASRMRIRDRDDVDPQWVAHHFSWVRGADGADRLVERPHFVPLPYRGLFLRGGPGDITQYTLSPGGSALRKAMVDVLIATLGARREPDELDGFYIVLTIDGKTVKGTIGGGVSFSMGKGEGDPVLMTKVASTLDAAVATGKFDALFVTDKEE